MCWSQLWNTSMANLSTSKQLLDLLSGWRADWKPIGWSTRYGFNHHKHWLLKFYLFINAAYVGVISPTSARFKVFVYICCIQASATGALALAFLCVAAASSLLTHLWLTYAMTWAHAVSFQWFGWLEIRSIDNWESRGKPNGGMHLLFYRENFGETWMVGRCPRLGENQFRFVRFEVLEKLKQLVVHRHKTKKQTTYLYTFPTFSS